MASLVAVNKEIRKMFPGLDIEAVKGRGYVYFDGRDGFDIIDSIMAHPMSTKTEDLVRMCVENIKEVYIDQSE